MMEIHGVSPTNRDAPRRQRRRQQSDEKGKSPAPKAQSSKTYRDSPQLASKKKSLIVDLEA